MRFGISKLAVVVISSFILAAGARADQISGGLAATDFGGGGTYGADSFSLSSLNLITSTGGDFISTVPALSDLTANTTSFSGLSSTPQSVSVADYLVFSSPDATFGSSGTTPTNRFNFTLESLTEVAPNAFHGAGTLYDSAGVYDATPASFTVGYSGPASYSFSFSATPVPEPSSVGLVALIVGGLALRRRPRMAI
jgi:hypothetical protein